MFAPHRYKNATSQASDPNFNNVSLLLHGDGTNGAQNNTFLDSSTNNFTITRNGTPTQGSFSPFNLNGEYSIAANGGSGYFNGTTDYLTIPDSDQFNLAANNFTIECWVYANSLHSFNGVFAQWPNNGGSVNNSFVLESVGSNMQFYWCAGSTLFGPATLGTITTGSWIHYAICRSGNTLYPFKNGVLGTTVSITQTLNNPTSNITVGGLVAGSGWWNGNISNLRLVNGTALYTSNFTPPTSPVTAVANTSLLCNFTNAGIFDNAAKNNLLTVGTARISTAQKKYGSGSMLFNGSTDYCRTIAPAGTHQFGTGDFTIECWAYCTNLAGGSSGNMMLVDFRQSTTNEVRPSLAILGSGFRYISSQTIRISSGTISANTWYHVAVVRSSGSTKLYVNGINVGVTYTDANNYLDGSPTIGNFLPNPIYGFAGYIDDVRITKGIARYTANFTPPTQAFPNL